MIAPNSIVSTNTIEPVIASIRRIPASIRTSFRSSGRLARLELRVVSLAAACDEAAGQLRPRQRAPLGICPAVGGDPSGRDPLGGFLLADKEMHRVGVAVVQLTRSTFAEATAGRESLQPSALRARCTRKDSG